MNSKTAILLFVRDASTDASQKTLTPNGNTALNKQLFEQLNRHILYIAISTELPVFRSDTFVKSQNDFGKDITSAVQEIFNKGFEKIICIGNDCPALNKSTILDAVALLETNKSVVGPDNRGGVYLLGLSKNSFDAQAFEQVAWKTPQMLASYLQITDKKVIVLKKMADVHTFQELSSYTAARYFTGFLLTLIHSSLRSGFYYPSFLFSSRSVATYSLRGPPSVAR